MRRRRKEVPNTAQRDLGLKIPDSAEGAPKPRGDRARFTDDSTGHLFIGAERLDQYLKRRGMDWVVQLRGELERLDYSALEASYQRIGRNPFHPRTMLGLIVYGILSGQWSLRGLENLAVRDVGAWWICGGQQPDHSTIGDFVNRHSEVLTQEFVLSLVKELVGRMRLQPGVVAGDGTVIEAAASHYRKLKTEAAQAAADKAREGAEVEPDNGQAQALAHKAQQAAQVAAQRTERRQRQGKPTESVVVSAREPEAVLQPRKDGAKRFAYKPSTLVHESGLIVAQAVHASSETAVVDELMNQHVEAFGTMPNTALFDAGYCQPTLLKDMVDRNVNVLCPSGKTNRGEDWEKKGHRGLFSKARFEYDEKCNVYRCPAGAELRQIEQSRDAEGRVYRAYATKACQRCELRAQCTTSRSGRKVKRYDAEEFKEAMAEVLRDPRARAEYRRRAPIVERPFAEFRERQALRRFHRCGLAGASVEFALHIIAFDLKWAIRRSGDAYGPTAVIIVIWACSGHQGRPWQPVAVFTATFTQSSNFASAVA